MIDYEMTDEDRADMAESRRECAVSLCAKYHFTPTSIGTFATVSCVCGESAVLEDGENF